MLSRERPRLLVNKSVWEWEWRWTSLVGNGVSAWYEQSGLGAGTSTLVLNSTNRHVLLLNGSQDRWKISGFVFPVPLTSNCFNQVGRPVAYILIYMLET